MRRTHLLTAAIVLMSAVVLAAAPPVTVDRSTGVSSVVLARVTPPARPVALTPAQYQALQQLQAEPEHAQVLGTSATYSAREKHLQFTRFSDDVWTVVYDVGWPGAYLAVLLCAL